MKLSYESFKEEYSKKSDETLINLYSSSELTDVAIKALIDTFEERNLVLPERSVKSEMDLKKEGLVESLWHGNKSITTSFFIVALLGSTLFVFFTAAIYKIVYGLLGLFEAGISTYILFCAYLFISVISLWRCSKNSNWLGLKKRLEQRESKILSYFIISLRIVYIYVSVWIMFAILAISYSTFGLTIISQ